MIRKLRKYDSKIDGELHNGIENLFVWNYRDYVEVRILEANLRKVRPVVVAYENKDGKDEVAFFEKDGKGLYIEDESLEFKEDDLVTFGYNNEKEYGTRIAVLLEYENVLDRIKTKLNMILCSSEGRDVYILTNDIFSKQAWIRKARDLEIRTFYNKAKTDDVYRTAIELAMNKKEEEEYKFKPFEKVLVRDADDETWAAGIYSYYVQNKGCRKLHGVCGNDYGYEQCIPYEGNEDLWMTTNKPKEG